jgi:hypothetical protein
MFHPQHRGSRLCLDRIKESSKIMKAEESFYNGHVDMVVGNGPIFQKEQHCLTSRGLISVLTSSYLVAVLFLCLSKSKDYMVFHFSLINLTTLLDSSQRCREDTINLLPPFLQRGDCIKWNMPLKQLIMLERALDCSQTKALCLLQNEEPSPNC